MKKQIIIAGMALCLFSPGLLRGQETGLLRLNPDRPEVQGEAAVWGGIEEGGFRPTNAASFLWKAGAGAQGVLHGDNVSWTGAISFEQMTGKNMGASMFLEPGYFPVDLMELTKGTKSRQTGQVEAGFLADLGYEWAAGVKASFKAANSLKQRNLHHSAFGMDMQVEPVITYVMDDNMGFVSSYHFRLRTERIKVGNDVEDANRVFLDEGMRYGVYADDLTVFPVREFSHGFNELFQSPELTMGLGLTWKRGQADNRFKFPGSTINAFFGQTFLADNLDHVYRIAYLRERDQLRASVPSEEGGTAGYQSASDRIRRNLNLQYEIRFIRGLVKNVGVDVDASKWNERSMMRLAFMDGSRRYTGSATLHSSLSYGAFDLDVNLLAARGWWREHGYNRESDGTGNLPARQLDDWRRNMDYCMSPRMGMGGSLTGRIPAVKGLYLQLYAYWHHAFAVSCLPGKNREIVTLKAGYNF